MTKKLNIHEIFNKVDICFQFSMILNGTNSACISNYTA